MQTRFLSVIFVAVALLAAIAVAAPTNVAGDKLVLKRSHTYKGTATWYKVIMKNLLISYVVIKNLSSFFFNKA
jgi:hypothetical protein